MATLKTPEEIAAQYGYSIDKQSSIDTAKKYYDPQVAALEGEKTTAYQTATQQGAGVQNEFLTDITSGVQAAGQAGMGTSGATLAAQANAGAAYSEAIGSIMTTLSSTITGLDAKINEVYANAAKAASSLYGKKLGVTNQFAQADFDNQVQQEQLDLQKAEMQQAYELAMKQIASNEKIAAEQIASNEEIASAQLAAGSAGNAAMIGALEDFAGIVQTALDDALGFESPITAVPPNTQGPPTTPPSQPYVDSDNDGKNDLTEKY